MDLIVGYLVTVIIGVSQDEQSFQSKFRANILKMNAYLTRKIDAGIGRPLQNLLLVQSCWDCGQQYQSFG